MEMDSVEYIDLKKRTPEEMACYFGTKMVELQLENKRLRAALEEISLGKGAFNMDLLKHASNCIEDMKAIAQAALKEENAAI
jgi:hypothetical protein